MDSSIELGHKENECSYHDPFSDYKPPVLNCLSNFIPERGNLQ